MLCINTRILGDFPLFLFKWLTFSMCCDKVYDIIRRIYGNIMEILLLIMRPAFLYYQLHVFHVFSMLSAGGDNINAGSIDVAVPKEVGQLRDVFCDTVKYPREQMPQVMGENLGWIYICLAAQCFHFPPDACPVHWLPCTCDKY